MSKAKVGISTLTAHDLDKYRALKLFKISKSLNIPLNEWLDREVDIPLELLRRDIIDGDYEAGFYSGVIARARSNDDISKPIAHSWIRLNCGTILDPVRWYLENTVPYMYVGDSQGYITGSEYRKNLDPCPPDSDGSYPIVTEFYDIVGEPTATAVRALLGVADKNESIDTNQLSWLLRLPLAKLGSAELAETIYQATIHCGYSNLLINENYREVFNEDLIVVIDQARKKAKNGPGIVSYRIPNK